MQGKFVWLALHRDQWGLHPFVFRAGEAIDKRTVARRLSLSFQPENGEGLDTLRLGPENALQDLSEPESRIKRELQRRYQGGS